MSVTTALVDPFKSTVTPTSGSPAAEVTRPLTVMSAMALRDLGCLKDLSSLKFSVPGKVPAQTNDGTVRNGTNSTSKSLLKALSGILTMFLLMNISLSFFMLLSFMIGLVSLGENCHDDISSWQMRSGCGQELETGSRNLHYKNLLSKKHS
ncbi:hypothetical protein [Rufibacter ruber]|uniref:hypothetical protein n=1 Tax=Rufibacter ruber TaxID=1783499 RepID=UPI001F4D55BC|nr:hypothetical protein [Rufibacter ruber]